MNVEYNSGIYLQILNRIWEPINSCKRVALWTRCKNLNIKNFFQEIYSYNFCWNCPPLFLEQIGFFSTYTYFTYEKYFYLLYWTYYSFLEIYLCHMDDFIYEAFDMTPDIKKQVGTPHPFLHSDAIMFNTSVVLVQHIVSCLQGYVFSNLNPSN